MRDISEIRAIVTEAMGIEDSELDASTVLTGNLANMATQVAIKSGQQIILNQGDNWQNILDQIL